MTQVFRFGLLGASRIAPTAVIAPVRKVPGYSVSAVAARDPARAGAYAAEHGIAAVAEDYAALVARDDVDIVYNALPPAGHAPWTMAALAAGKAVLCEKPFACDAAEARAMVEAAKARGLILLEAFHYRFHAVIRRAEAMMRDGVLGQLRAAVGEFHAPIPRTPTELRWSAEQHGGAVMDLGCYPLHALRTLIGAEPRVTSARIQWRGGIDAATSADLLFPGGVEAKMACSMTRERPAGWLTIEGERGRLEIVNFMAPQYGCRFTTTIEGETVSHPVEGPTTYEAQLAHLHEVMTGAAAPLTGGADAMANMALIDAIKRAGGR
ncbi:MAG TPA: Gfo/Idh/MocA family oxidoreductase [Caulobacteraceae bacterium]